MIFKKAYLINNYLLWNGHNNEAIYSEMLMKKNQSIKKY